MRKGCGGNQRNASNENQDPNFHFSPLEPILRDYAEVR
jgi:hypothetical protein